MPKRLGQTIWIIALTHLNKEDFPIVSKILSSLIGKIYLLSELSCYDTMNTIIISNLQHVFTDIVNRTNNEQHTFEFWSNLSTLLKINRYKRCILIDTDPQAIVGAKLLGWVGCLIQKKKSLFEFKKNRCGDTQIGRGVWYDCRFDHINEALYHYVFGSI